MGGNLDNKELGAGAKLFLPVFVPGALFPARRPRRSRRRRMVCVTPIETRIAWAAFA